MPYADPEKKKQVDRDYGNRNKEARAARGKEWRSRNPERQKLLQRKHHLKKTFGMTLEDYDSMSEKQDHKCAICNTEDTKPWNYFVVDHCHERNKVRGLLCHPCNVVIGQAKDNINILQNAIIYLERNK